MWYSKKTRVSKLCTVLLSHMNGQALLSFCTEVPLNIFYVFYKSLSEKSNAKSFSDRPLAECCVTTLLFHSCFFSLLVQLVFCSHGTIGYRCIHNHTYTGAINNIYSFAFQMQTHCHRITKIKYILFHFQHFYILTILV